VKRKGILSAGIAPRCLLYQKAAYIDRCDLFKVSLHAENDCALEQGPKVLISKSFLYLIGDSGTRPLSLVDLVEGFCLNWVGFCFLSIAFGCTCFQKKACCSWRLFYPSSPGLELSFDNVAIKGNFFVPTLFYYAF